MSPGSRIAGSVVLGVSGCETAGWLAGPPGDVSLEVSNETEFLGIVEVLQVADDHTWDELVEWIADENRRASDDESPRGRPPWAEDRGRVEVEAGGTEQLSATIEPGAVGLVCMQVDLPETDRNPFVLMVPVGPFEVR